MPGRGICASLFLLVASTANAEVAGPPTQLSFGPGDAVNPAVSAGWVTWTEDTGQPNGLDIYALARPNGAATDETPVAGGQYLSDVDGHFATYLDDSGAFVGVMLKDLSNNNAPVPINGGDNVSGSHPAVENPANGVTWHVVYVRGGNHPDVVYVPDLFGNPSVLTDGSLGVTIDSADMPRIGGDYVVFQGFVPNDNQHHIWIWRISQGGPPHQLTAGGDDTDADTDGANVVFTRGGTAIFSIPVGGGAPVQLSTPNAPSTRDRAHVSGKNVVWDDHRNGVDCDVYWSAVTGGGDQLVVGGPGNQYLTDLDGSDVVYTNGPVGGPYNVYIVTLYGCLQSTDCANGQVCLNNACGPCKLNGQCPQGDVCYNGECGPPQCVNNGGCNGGQVCINNACVPCANDNQCNQGLVCTNGSCVQPQMQKPKPDPDGCGNGTAIVTVEMQQPWHVPVVAGGFYVAKANHHYWVCVVNGDGDPAKRTSSFIFVNDFFTVLTPANFKPNNNPPKIVTAPLTTWPFFKWQMWSAMLFGPHPPEAVKVKILESW